jgi:hypothetical protein
MTRQGRAQPSAAWPINIDAQRTALKAILATERPLRQPSGFPTPPNPSRKHLAPIRGSDALDTTIARQSAAFKILSDALKVFSQRVLHTHPTPRPRRLDQHLRPHTALPPAHRRDEAPRDGCQGKDCPLYRFFESEGGYNSGPFSPTTFHRFGLPHRQSDRRRRPDSTLEGRTGRGRTKASTARPARHGVGRRKSLAIEEKQGNEHGAASTYHQLGSIAQQQRDFGTAEAWYRKSLAIKEKQGNEHGAAQSYAVLGLLAGQQDKLVEAAQWLIKSIRGFMRTNDERSTQTALGALLHCYQRAPHNDQQAILALWDETGLGPFPEIPGG